jgi:3-dehydrotetronate 4-kinase
MAIGLGIIADDFTGGLMVASHIERDGTTCPYVVDVDAVDNLGDHDALVIATRLRFMRPSVAIELLDEITTKLVRLAAEQIIYKYCATFDSTDEGNIGPCADLLMEKFDLNSLLFCPGFPDFRIYVHEGYMFYKDRIISESIKRFDPLTPMADPDMARVLQRQTRRKVGLLPHRVLHQGLEYTRSWMASQQREGVEYFMMDSVDNDDINCGARLVADSQISTGGDALPIALAQLRRSRRPLEAQTLVPALYHADGVGAVIAGSCGPATLEQLEYFERNHPVLRIDLAEVASVSEAVDEAVAWARQHIGDRPVAVTTATGPEGVQKAQLRWGTMEAARRAELILASTAAGLFEAGVRRFVVSGGETSGAVVEALGIRQMRVAPFDDLGAGCCVATDPAHMSLFLKPGKIGAPNVFEAALARMQGPVVRQ